MSNKDQNNNHSWKDRLEELENIPVEPSQDKKMLWEKLQSRLEEKNTSKKKAWYWWAAAAVLLLCMLPWIIKEEKQDAFVQNKPAKQNAPDIKIINQQNTTTVKPSNNTAIKNNSAIIITANKKITVEPVIENKITVAVPEEIKQPDPVITIVKSIPVIDSSKSTAASTMQKKKLAVVHINELENNGQLIPANNGYNNFRRFIRPSNKDVSIETPVNSQYNGDHIIIKNLNPQNSN